MVFFDAWFDLFQRQQDSRFYACRAAGVHNQIHGRDTNRIGHINNQIGIVLSKGKIERFESPAVSLDCCLDHLAALETPPSFKIPFAPSAGKRLPTDISP